MLLQSFETSGCEEAEGGRTIGLKNTSEEESREVFFFFFSEVDRSETQVFLALRGTNVKYSQLE